MNAFRSMPCRTPIDFRNGTSFCIACRSSAFSGISKVAMPFAPL